jgi:sugar phosphate isomerase/epimerase
VQIGVCADSFSDAHARAGLEPDPHTPFGLLELARASELDIVELSSHALLAIGPEGRSGFADETRQRGVRVVVDTGGKETPEEIGRDAEEAVRMAREVGATVVRTTISRCLEGDRGRYGLEGWKERLAALVEPLRRATALAAEDGIAVGVENHQDLCSAELLQLCDEVDRPEFGVVMDVGNALAVGEHPATFAARIMPFLKHVQLKDYEAHASPEGWRLVRCALGEGVVDWPDMIARFDAGAPAALGCIELGNASARHIRLLEESWWRGFDERPREEMLQGIRALHAAEMPRGLDWRTPGERGDDPREVVAFELAQYDRSVEYLRRLG